MKIVGLQPQHLEGIQLQTAQLGVKPWITREYADALIAAGPAYAALDDDDAVIGAGGILPQWEGRSIAWALLTTLASRHMVAITRAVLDCFAGRPERRIEIWVDLSFEAGHRWARLLGFKPEGHMRGFTPSGEDAVLYGRVR